MTMAVTIPSVTERFTEGFTQDTADNRNAELDSGGPVKADDMDLYTVTSGRTEIWPFVIEKIAEQPIWGHGRHAMIRSGSCTLPLEFLSRVIPSPTQRLS